MTSFQTDASPAGPAGGASLFVFDNTGLPFNFMLVAVISSEAITSAPAEFTLRHSHSAGAATVYIYTAELTVDQSISDLFDTGGSTAQVGWISVAFESDASGSLFENDSVHTFTQTTLSGSTVAESYPSQGFPFVFTWVADEFTVDPEAPYFETDESTRGSWPPGPDEEWLILSEPGICSGFPATYPFDMDLPGQTLRYQIFADMAGTPNARPPGCTVLVPWHVGYVGSR